MTLFVKIMLAIASGAAAAVHAVGRSRVALAVGGAIGLLAALGAMFCGYLLTTGSSDTIDDADRRRRLTHSTP